jgi:hypothetical protein
LQSGLGGNQHVRTQPCFRDRVADNLLRTAKSVDRRGVDEVDAMLEGGADGTNGFRLVGTAPHPSADRPGTDRDG